MNEENRRNLHAIEGRAALKAAAQRASRVRDKFNRPIQVGDGIVSDMTQPLGVVWRVTAVTPATEPQLQGGVWADVMAVTRVLFQGGVPHPNVLLALPGKEEEENSPLRAPAADAPPGAAVSSGGIILSDPDQRGE